MICLICQQEARCRHRRKELDYLGAGAGGDVLDVRGHVIENHQEGRVNGVELSLACCHESVDGLVHVVSKESILREWI